MKAIIALLLFAAPCFGQSQNLYFIKKHRPVEFESNDYQPGKKAFYIYRNCVYYFVLKNKQELSARVVDIKNDSIYYTVFSDSSSLDTLAMSPSNLKKVRLIADRMMGIMAGCSLQKRRYVFVNSPESKSFAHRNDTIFSKDRSNYTVYELVPYLSYQGVGRLYQQCEKTYYYEGAPIPECKDTVKTYKPPIVKKWFWFTPSAANVIKGVNIGLETMHVNDEPLTIKGVNLNAGALAFFVSCFTLFHLGSGNTLINMEDTVDKSKTVVWMKGASISAGGLMGDMEVKGFSINGGNCSVTETKGLVISGAQNVTYEFSGVVITGLRNRAIKGSGAQIGLLNICKHLKGVQIGLWNVNSKRKLPLINWSF
jgi:hypothetical protein